MRIWNFLACAMAVVSTSALAQDGSEASAQRTVDGAQRFLNQFLPTSGALGSFTVVVPNFKWQNWRFPRTGESYRDVASIAPGAVARIARVRALSTCASTFDFADIRITDSAGIVDPSVPALPLSSQKGGITIDWNSVRQVTQLNHPNGFHYIEPEIPGQTFRFIFKFSDAEFASRTAFAMDFLRSACATKSETGF